MNLRPAFFAGLRLLALLLVPSAHAILPSLATLSRNFDAARTTLRAALAQESGWPKVHAAEVLINQGEARTVRAVFLAEEKLHATEPRYRSGIWRTLARTASTPAERAIWTGRIAAVFIDPAAPDRLHALESLCKLGAPHSPAVQTAAAAWLPAATPEDAVFLQWLRWQSGDPAARVFIASQLHSPVLDARLRAAYILRRTNASDAPALAALASAADREPAGSLARVYLIGAAYALRANPDRHDAWRASLEALVTQGTATETYEALQALMLFYRPDDGTRLLPLLTHAEGDVRIAAAWTILYASD